VTALEAVRDLAASLGESGVPSPRVDAEILVSEVLGITRSELYADGREVSDDEVGRLESLAERRRAREPLAYILGEWGFRGLNLKADGRALIPRPETEVVVERCLVHVRDIPEPRVLDVGVGSGAIALSIADEHPGAKVVGVDYCASALSLAEENRARTAVDGRVQLLKSDLLDEVAGQFDLVVSNPPYVSPDEYEGLQPEIRLYEPRKAVIGVEVGAEIAREARSVLVPGGWIVLECGDGHGAHLAAELEVFGYTDVVQTPDLAGRDRVVEGRWE
jgi:release factor glutamine methyltransferase